MAFILEGKILISIQHLHLNSRRDFSLILRWQIVMVDPISKMILILYDPKFVVAVWLKESMSCCVLRNRFSPDMSVSFS